MAVLKQGTNSGVEVAHQVCILYAVVNNYLKDISLDRIPEFEKRLYEYMDNRHADVLTAIRTSGKLEPDTEAALKSAVIALLQEFTAQQ